MLKFAPPLQVFEIESEIFGSSSRLEMSEEIEGMLNEKFERFFKSWFSIKVGRCKPSLPSLRAEFDESSSFDRW